MQTLVLTIHILIALGLVGAVLLQRSEGGGLGIGGGSGGRAHLPLLTLPVPRPITAPAVEGKNIGASEPPSGGRFFFLFLFLLFFLFLGFGVFCVF